MTTTGTRFRRIEEIVDEALDRPARERAAYVQEACGGDDVLRDEVASLLAAHDDADDFLETSAVERFKGALLAEGDVVGNYTIVRVLGAGGGGTVYLAQQDQPRRFVALKAMHGGFTTDAASRRFRQEAEILGRLQHPSIAHVYEAGVHAGMPFMALEYVEDARSVLEAARGDGRKERLRLFAAVCDAVHAGHLEGVVHRDLKPANILVRPSGHPKIIDFGIARVEEAGQPVDMAGTPPYMSPEQCTQGTDLDLRSDIYSLGVVLYELLQDRVPHDVGNTPLVEAARRIREDAPAPLDPGIPADLRAIVERAMAKDPEDRYASASRLADDLRRFLAGEPVAARPAGRLHELHLFARRNPAIVGVLALLLVVLGAAAIVSLAFASRAATARDRERMQAYVANLAAAEAAIRDHDIAEATARLRSAAPELRGWAWQLLASRLDESLARFGDPDWLTFHAIVSRDDNAVIELAHEHPMDGLASIARWSVDEGRLLARTTFEAYPTSAPVECGPWIAWGTKTAQVLVARASDLEIVHRLDGDERPIYGVAAEPGGRRLLAADAEGRIRVWTLGDGSLAREFGDDGRSYAHATAWSTNAPLVAIATEGSEVDLWHVERGVRVGMLRGHDARVQAVWFVDGGHLVTASSDGTIRVWDAETQAQLRVLRGPGHAIVRASLSDDRTQVLCAHDDRTLRRWDLTSGEVSTPLLGHTENPRAVAWLGSDRVLSADAGGGMRLWSLRKREETRGTYRAAVRDVDYSPDRRWIATASFDGTVRLHSRNASGEERIFEGHERRVQSIDFRADSKKLVSGGTDLTIRIWDVARGTCDRMIEHTSVVLTVVYDDRWIASSDGNGDVVLWDPRTGEPIRSFPHPSWTTAIMFRPNGRMVTACLDGTVRRWDTRTGRLEKSLHLADKLVTAALSPDGSTLAVCSQAPYDAAWRAGRVALHFIDLASWERTRSIAGVGGGSVVYHPDGSRLATASGEGLALVDCRSGRRVLHIARRYLWDVAFSPDGTQLATGSGSYVGHDCALHLYGRMPGVAWPPALDGSVSGRR